MIFGYVLCSKTDKKHEINKEIRHLIQLGAESDYVFVDYHEFTSDSGQELKRIFSMIREGDTLLATSPARMAKNSLQMCELIENVRQCKAKLVLGSIILDCTGLLDSVAEGMLDMAGIFKMLEKERLVSARKNISLVAIKSKKRKVGRPPLSIENIPGIFHRYYPKYISKEINVTELSRLCNISRTMIYRYIDVVKSTG